MAIDKDRTWHDGRLRNAYAAGVVTSSSAKLPGWWDNTQNKWLEDRYQVGSDVRRANSASACGFQRGRSPRMRRGSARRSKGLTSPELFRASSNQLLCWDPAIKGSCTERPL